MANIHPLQKNVDMVDPKKRGVAHYNSAVYGFGLIGALIYFVQHAAGFWEGLLGILKAIAWPAFLVYKLLDHLKM